MLLGRVVGEVWSTVKDEKLEGAKFLIVQQVDLQNKLMSNFIVAVDSVEAGLGDIVLVAQGSSARQTKQTTNKPVDAVIMGIVDRLDVVPEAQVEADFQKRKAEIEGRLARLKED